MSVENQSNNMEKPIKGKQDMEQLRKAKRPFNVMVFPNGTICNLACVTTDISYES